MNSKHSILTYASVITAMLCWSLSFIWYKQAFIFYKPVTVIFLRLLIAVPLLFALSWTAGKSVRIQKGHLPWFILLGFFQPFLYFMGESYGVRLLTSTTASVIVSTIPLFAPIAALIFYRERFTVVNYIGLIISFTGVVLILTSEGGFVLDQITGVMLMMVAVFSAIFYSVFVKRLMVHYSAFTIVAYQSLFGLFLFLPFFVFSDLSHFLTVQSTMGSLLPIVKLGVFASSFAFILFVFSIKNLGIAKTNVFVNLIPVLTATFAFFLLHENFPFIKIVGIIIVVTGLMVTQNYKFDTGLLKGRKSITG
ncbi:MAG: DMT family transporter [Bacteroidales bacterium]|nr:DMT family transporter [Bacteroidales bacterium]